ncbi:hypothetical protein QUF80_21775 [Desulfococcaceae bacterium HSG8]|nr:hypothetical protein [Desulfococcaceae bacterium HSG8]
MSIIMRLLLSADRKVPKASRSHAKRGNERSACLPGIFRTDYCEISFSGSILPGIYRQNGTVRLNFGSRITFHILRITHHASRITHYASRITHHASRFTHHSFFSSIPALL